MSLGSLQDCVFRKRQVLLRCGARKCLWNFYQFPTSLSGDLILTRQIIHQFHFFLELSLDLVLFVMFRARIVFSMISVQVSKLEHIFFKKSVRWKYRPSRIPGTSGDCIYNMVTAWLRHRDQPPIKTTLFSVAFHRPCWKIFVGFVFSCIRKTSKQTGHVMVINV